MRAATSPPDQPDSSPIFPSPNCYLTTKQAAFHLGLSVRSLEGLRYRGRGPRGYRMGRGWYYLVRDLDSWARRIQCGVD